MELKKKFTKHKAIVSNTFFLSVIQLVNLAVPLVALPYVIRTIGTSSFGQIAFAQSIASYFFILINFGLDISAVKEVSQNRDNKERLSQIVSSVLGVKLLLFTISAILFSALIIAVPGFRSNPVLFFVVFSASISEVLFPTWYYQGVERMAIISLVKLIAVVFYLSTLFFVVKQSSDYLYVPMLQVGGAILSAIVGFAMMLRVEKIRLEIPAMSKLIATFRESIPFFMSRLSIVINSNIATTLSGIFLGMNEVAAFDIAKKIVMFAFLPLQMLFQAVYPHNANKLDRVFARKLLYVILVIDIMVISFVYVMAPLAVHFFAGDNLDDAVTIIRLLSFYLLFGSFGNYLGSPVLVAFGHPKPFNVSVYLSTMALILCYGVFYAFNSLSLINFAIALIVSEFVIMSYRFYSCVKLKII